MDFSEYETAVMARDRAYTDGDSAAFNAACRAMETAWAAVWQARRASEGR